MRLRLPDGTGETRSICSFTDNNKSPIPATTEPRPGLAQQPPTPPASVLKEHDGTFETRSFAGKAQEQMIAGVPNELLLPGAIGALAVVIIAVFTISRASGSNR